MDTSAIFVRPEDIAIDTIERGIHEFCVSMNHSFNDITVVRNKALATYLLRK